MCLKNTDKKNTIPNKFLVQLKRLFERGGERHIRKHYSTCNMFQAMKSTTFWDATDSVWSEIPPMNLFVHQERVSSNHLKRTSS
jgi:hypothetical protein